MKDELSKEDKEIVDRILYSLKLTTKPSKNPTVHFIVAPPGSGKTGLEIYLNNEMSKHEEDTIKIGSDKIAALHPEYDKWVQLPAEECYSVSRKFTVPASNIIYEDLRNSKMNMLFEKTFHKGASDLEFVKKFKDAGYKVIINVMATDKYESILSCHERDIKASQIGLAPRPVSRKNFDRMYTTFLSEIISMENQKLCDEIRVFKRGEKMSEPGMIYKSGDTNYMNAFQAVEEERRKERQSLYNPNSSVNFQERINKAIEDVKRFIDNETIRENSIKELEQLQLEFIQDLSRSMKII